MAIATVAGKVAHGSRLLLASIVEKPIAGFFRAS